MNTRGLMAVLVAALSLAVQAENWPEWRGPQRDGIARDKGLPVRWSANENVLWKTELPGPGNSSPIVWEDKVFIAQAIEGENRRTVMAFDRATGKQLWQTGVVYAEPEKSHPQNPQAAASPSTDGKHVYAFFGSAGLFAFDMNGKQVWKREFGKHVHDWGYASSPVIHGELCILNFGPGEQSFLVAVDKNTGKTVWQQKEPALRFEKDRTDGFAGKMGQYTGSWGSPIIVRANNRDELVMAWSEHVRAFNPKTGATLWTCDGLNPLIYSSPVYGEGLVVAMGGFAGTSIAVKPGGSGDVTATHRAWQQVKSGQRIGSGVIHQGHIYVLESNGLATCMDLQTGKTLWSERVRGPGPKSETWSSMVLSDGKLYTLNQSSETFVLEAKPEFKILNINTLDNAMCNSSLAASNGDFFIRTYSHLWCISAKGGKKVASVE